MSLVLLGILNSQVSAAGAGAFDHLETQILTSTATSIEFTGLDSYSDYRHLVIRAALRSTINRDGRLTFNGDFGSNYRWGSFGNLGGTSTSATYNTGSNGIYSYQSIADDTNANEFSSWNLYIPEFNQTTKKKSVIMQAGTNFDYANTMIHRGFWNNTAAITSFAIACDGGTNIYADSRVSLYGVK